MISIVRKITNKKMHSWATERNTESCWILNKKQLWQPTDEKNSAYKVYTFGDEAFLSCYNGFVLIKGGAFEVYDATLDTNILVTTHGVVNKERNTGDWQMLRR